VGIIKVNF